MTFKVEKKIGKIERRISCIGKLIAVWVIWAGRRMNAGWVFTWCVCVVWYYRCAGVWVIWACGRMNASWVSAKRKYYLFIWRLQSLCLLHRLLFRNQSTHLSPPTPLISKWDGMRSAGTSHWLHCDGAPVCNSKLSHNGYPGHNEGLTPAG